MKRLADLRGMSRKTWLTLRKQGLGGSDAGAVCGMNPYRTAMQVYYDKTSEEMDDTDSEAMRQGRELEAYVAQRFMEATGKKVRKSNYMYVHETYHYMIADIDRLVVGERAGLECKTASPYMAEQWKDGEIPAHYLLQCHHYMMVTGLDAWYIAVLIYGKEFKYQRIERDERIMSALIRIEQYFWEEQVQKRCFPEPDGSEMADRVIGVYFKAEKDKSILLTGFAEDLKRREELQGLISRMDTEKKQIEQRLKIFLGEAEAAEGEGYRVSWKNVVSSRLDTERLKQEQPEVYRNYLTVSNSRRFSVKAA